MVWCVICTQTIALFCDHHVDDLRRSTNACNHCVDNSPNFAESLIVYIYIVFSTNASCKSWEKLIPLASARSFSHAGIVKVFFTDLLFLHILKEYIQKYAGENSEEIEAVWFQNGVEFLEKFHSDFDILLLDIEMPVMDGISVARDARKVDDYMIIIFITNMAQYAIHGYEVNALDYVIKPIAYYPFSVKLRRAIRMIREICLSKDLSRF